MATINYTVGDNWGSGFIGNIKVPGGTSGLQGWTLEFDATFDISNIWGAEIVSHVGNHYVIRNVAWSADVPAGGQASFGFEASPGSGGTTATGFTLNGAADTPTPPPVVPTISIDDASITEGDSGTSQLTFTVKLSQAASGPVTVNYSTANGTATAGADYSALSGTITFAAGETTKTITIPVTGDTAVETNETFTVTLASPAGATIADGAATGTIVNNDVAPPPPPPTGGGLSLDYDIVSNWGSGFTASMAVGAGSAALNGWTVEFDASFNITSIWNATIVSHVGNHYVVKNADWNGNVAGGKETSFGFQATPGGGGTTASGFTINGTTVGTDPVPVPTLSVADATVAEGNSGAPELVFTVTLSAAATGPVTVAYATSNGTASASSDYTAQSGTLTFAAGETSKVVRVQVSGDTAVEANETLTLALSSPSGATIADGTAIGTITNDDTAPLPALSVADATVSEGNSGAKDLAFTVSLSAAATGPVTVAYVTNNGTATAGSDYTAASGTLTFAAGETSKVVHVQVSGDTAVEGNETLTLTLASPSGATIADGTAIGTITNDDTAPLPTISISDASVVEGDPGEGGAAPGWFSTSGNQIVDSGGHSVQIAGVNWFGFESSNLAPHGLWTRGYQDMMNQMKDLGFNTIRLPFSNDTIHSTGTPNGIDFSKNPDLQGLTAMQIMDKIVAYAGEIGLKIILDHHRNDSGRRRLAQRPVVRRPASRVAVDLRLADAGGPLCRRPDGDRRRPAQRAARRHLGRRRADRLGGGGRARRQRHRRGQSQLADLRRGRRHLSGPALLVGRQPDGRARPADRPQRSTTSWSTRRTTIPTRYGPSRGSRAATSRPTCRPSSTRCGATSTRRGSRRCISASSAPTSPTPRTRRGSRPSPPTWRATSTTTARATSPAGNKGVSWTFWSWNPNSGDTGGILANDWRTVNQDKMAYLTPIEFDFDSDVSGGGSSGPHATFLVTLSAPATGTVTVDYHTVAGTAGSADFTGISGTVTFAAGETSKTITIAIAPDTLVEGNEQFSVVLSNPQSATIADGTGVGTIVDDDTAQPVVPTLAIGDASITEGDSGTAQLSFTVTLSQAATGPVTVNYSTANGTATAGSDYTARSGTVTFAAGETTKTVTVPITGDGAVEGNETFTISLAGASGATIADGAATGTIVNNDSAPLPSGDLEAQFSLVNSWSSGFNGNVLVHNEGSSTTGWQIVIDMPYQITDIWNAAIVSHVGNSYVIGPSPWNGTLAHDGETSFGFVASGQFNAAAIQVHGVGEDDVPDSVPTVPTDLVATAVSATSTMLSWDASSVPGGGFVTGYAIFVDGEQVATTTSTSYRVTGLSADTDYQFSVAAIDAAGSSAQTSPVSVHTTLPLPDADDGHMFSPYIDMAMSNAADLAGISAASGITNFTLAFVLASNEGIGWQGWGSIDDDTLFNGTTILQHVQDIQAAGGNITISFGGAAGTEAALVATSAAELQAQYQSVIDRYGIDSIDFDIEGAAVANQQSLVLRDQAIAGLQAANPDLKVSFTLPVLPTGLTADGLHVLQQAMADGVRVDMVNIMAMDYGTSVDNNGQMGLSAIQASESTQQQLAAIGLDAKIGITPMIGVNDIVSEVFKLSDAQMLVDYAANDPDVAMLSMWSVARDNGNTAGIPAATPDSSGIAQDPYEFASIFHQYDIL